MGGQCAVYHTVKELPELADVCAAAPAVVFAFGTREEAALPPAAEALAAHNPRFCAVCLAEPDALQHILCASTVSAWDRPAAMVPSAARWQTHKFEGGANHGIFRCDVMSESLGISNIGLVTMPDTGDLAAAPVVYLLHG
ncbi:MAG: hypothetical protein ACLR51_07605 [Subdoligranulum sp.]